MRGAYNRGVAERHELTRRDAIRLGALGAGALAFARLPPSLRAAITRTPPPGGLDQVRHVVLYMQENRSFDHYFGTLRGVRGYADRTAVRTRATSTMFEQPHPMGGMVLPFSTRAAAARQQQDVQYIESTPHGWDDGIGSWARGWNDGWIANKGAMTMCTLDRDDIPFQYEMAEAFTICDAYHCSVPSSTSPNRNYFVSGHTGFEPGTQTRAVTNAGYDDAHPGYEWPTYAELLEDAGVDWKVYHEWDDFEDNNLDLFKSFKDIAARVLEEVDGGPHPSIDGFYMSLFDLPAAQQDARLAQLDAAVEALAERERSLFNRSLRRSRPGTLAQSIADDIAAGTFPTVAWVVTSAAECEHPDTSSPIQGARVTYDVLDVIAADRETWDHTVFLYTFDENDGLFDHVPPPVPPSTIVEEYEGDRPVGLGARVPMIVVSPWTVGGWVCSQTFDHTSMIRFLERVTGVETDQITPWRRRVAGDLVSVFDFAGSGSPATLAQPGEIPEFVERWAPQPPSDQQLPTQEEGTRPARPLPYQPDARATLAEELPGVTLANDGSESAHFAVFAWHDTTADPVHVDVAGGEQAFVAVPIPGVFYSITVLGPNRFLRDFAGSVRELGSNIDVRSEVVAVQATTAGDRSRAITITVANVGDEAAVEVTVSQLAYLDGEPRELELDPGADTTVELDLEESDGWYDIEVTVAEDATFRRRLTGHVEDGLASVSG